MTTDYQIGLTYSFNVFPVALLGNNFQNVVVQAILDAGTTQQLGVDIQALAKQMYPLLPSGTPSDPTTYQYLKLQLASGASVILAVPWIDDSSVELVTQQTIVATISNVSSQDLSRIKLALVQNGYNNVSLALQ
jgi:hypothetical protein